MPSARHAGAADIVDGGLGGVAGVIHGIRRAAEVGQDQREVVGAVNKVHHHFVIRSVTTAEAANHRGLDAVRSLAEGGARSWWGQRGWR